MSERFNIGVHELLRYLLPGYTFLFILLLPWIVGGVYDFFFTNWEQFAALFLVGGFVVGHLLYHFYYWIFSSFLYNENRRASLKKACLLLKKEKVDEDVRALQTMAFFRTKDKSALEACKFQFSVFHSIGTTWLSVLLGYILSFIIPVTFPNIVPFMSPMCTQKTLGFIRLEALLLVPTFILLCILCSAYWYRFKLGVRMEDYIALQNLEKIINENSSIRNTIKDMLQKKE